MSTFPSVFLVTYSVEACQFNPQNRLSLFTSTVDLYKSISNSENGCRTQLLADTRSPSATTTCSPGVSTCGERLMQERQTTYERGTCSSTSNHGHSVNGARAIELMDDLHDPTLPLPQIAAESVWSAAGIGFETVVFPPTLSITR